MRATHRALEHRFAIDGDAEGIDLLSRLLEVFEVTPDELGDETDTCYSLRHDGAWRAWRNDVEFQTSDPAAAPSVLMTAINVGAIGSVGHLFVGHAAVVALDGGAVALVGRPGAGKSTLVARLVAAGARYLSDEACPVTDDGLVLPYPKPIVVGRGSWESLGALAPADLAAGRLGHWFLDPRQLAGGVQEEPIRLRDVLLVEYRPREAFRFERVSPAAVVTALASNGFTFRDHPEHSLEVLARLAPSVTGATVVHGGDADIIDRLFEEVAS